MKTRNMLKGNGGKAMKKWCKAISCFLFCAILMVGIFSPKSYAADTLREGSCGDNVNWKLDSDGVLTVSGQGPMKSYGFDWQGYVPLAPWAGYRSQIKKVVIEDGVTSVGEAAFCDCSNMTEVVIGNDVETIDNYAFAIIDGYYYTSNLRTVTIGSGLKNVGANAFERCRKIEKVYINDLNTWCGIDFENSLAQPLWYSGSLYIDGDKFDTGNLVVPEGLTAIGDYTFYGFDLDRVQIPDNVIRIGNGTFAGNNLESIELPHALQTIGESAFSSCLLRSVEIPDSVTSIGESAFGYCTKLGSVSLPDTLETINNRLFENCSALSDLNIPDSVKSIGNSVFSNCTSLQSIRIPDTVKSIGADAFFGCSGLKEIALPKSLESIGRSAFARCSGLAEIKLPGKLSEIGDKAFQQCTGLKKVFLLQEETGTGSENSPVTVGNFVFENCTALEDVTLPNSTISIGEYAFNNCTSLGGLTLPENLTSIGKYAFKGCTALQQIAFPSNMQMVEAQAFAGCSALSKIDFGSGLQSIGTSAFSGCAPTEITIPASVTSIGATAFQNCSAMKTVIFEGDCPVLGADCFQNVHATCYYPEGNDTYTNQIKTSDFGGELIWTYAGEEIPEDSNKCGDNCVWELSENGVLHIIGSGEMYDYAGENFEYAPWYESRNSIQKIEIDDEITHIGNYAFCGTKSATEVIIPDSVKTIGHYAFESCGVKTMHVPVNLESIGAWAFKSSKLESFEFPEGLTKIGTGAFSESGLRSASLPEGLTEIPESMFEDARSLSTVIFPSTLKSIGSSAFSGCIYLHSVEIPEGAVSIGDYAFYSCGAYDTWATVYPGCNNFTAVSLPSTLQYLGKSAFSYCQVLKSITIPDKVKHIYKYTFSQCKRLASVTLPAGIETIEEDAFFTYGSLKTIVFRWNAPEIENGAFSSEVNATCYYHGENPDWTSDKLQNYGSKQLTWVDMDTGSTGGAPIGGPEVEGGAEESGAQITPPKNGWTEGKNIFKVSSDQPCIVATSNDGGLSYQPLPPTPTSDGYLFTAEDVTEDTTLALVVIGDVNGDGKVSNADLIKLKAYTLGKITLNPVALLAADVNHSNDISNADTIRLKAVLLGKSEFTW